MNSSPLFRLPYELRLQIYSSVLGPTRSRPLYIQRYVWSWNSQCLKTTKSQQCHNLLVVCRQMYNDIIEILYRRHEIQLYTTCDGQQSNVRRRLCGIEDYTNVLLNVRKLKVILFCSSDPDQERVLLALMGYLKAILAERNSPLETLMIVMCAMDGRDCKPTAVIYAAQGFRSFGMTRFHFQCGFSGVGSESAMEALMLHANEKVKFAGDDLSKEAALEKLTEAWMRTLPSWWNLKWRSNQWLQTTFEV